MESTALVRIIREYCLKHASVENVKKYSRYFKTGYNAYGLSQPEMQAGAREMLLQPGINLPIVLKSASELIKSGKYEETALLILLVQGLHKQFDRPAFEEISGWYDIGIENWAHADGLGMGILPLFMKKDIVKMHDFKPWLKSPHKFKRRCVPVTMIKWLKTDPDIREVFHFLEILMKDAEREVHQGMGWFLREAWKKKPAETEAFLLTWKNECPRLIIQYATERMDAPAKLKFKKEKTHAKSA